MVPDIDTSEWKDNKSLGGKDTPIRKENKDRGRRTFLQSKSSENPRNYEYNKGGERSREQNRPREIERG